jgi:hypothetical protein
MSDPSPVKRARTAGTPTVGEKMPLVDFCQYIAEKALQGVPPSVSNRKWFIEQNEDGVWVANAAVAGRLAGANGSLDVVNQHLVIPGFDAGTVFDFNSCLQVSTLNHNIYGSFEHGGQKMWIMVYGGMTHRVEAFELVSP